MTSCTDNDNLNRLERAQNKLLTGGCQDVAGHFICGFNEESDLVGRCQRVQADYVFEYLAFVAGIAVIAMSFFLNRSGGGRSAAYV